MAGFAEFGSYDALGLAELVRKKEVTPAELIEEVVARIERVNPTINAVVTKMYDQARSAARQPAGKGAFAGVPFLLKDLLANFAGVPLSAGSRFYGDYTPDHDSELVGRYKRAGLVVVAKTNTPEFGLMPVTEPERWGPARNPWNTERATGGSSGGAAAAVAARIVPMAHGGDGGGSIRIPSSCCGLFGLKPTRGRNPIGPDNTIIWNDGVQEHVLTRTVRDSAAALDATAGPDAGAFNVPPQPERPYLNEVGQDPGKLRIAFTKRISGDHKIHPECLAAVEDAARLCADLGHEVVEDDPGIDCDAFYAAFVVLLLGETGADIVQAEALTGRKAAVEGFEPGTWAMKLLGERRTSIDFAVAVRTLGGFARKFGRWFVSYDVFLTPTLAKPPVPIGTITPQGVEAAALKVLTRLGAGVAIDRLGGVQAIAEPAIDFTPFTALFNQTGQPAMSVPLHWNAEGLPIGTQFVGRFGDEATLFRLAGQLERARPWADRVPPVHA